MTKRGACLIGAFITALICLIAVASMAQMSPDLENQFAGIEQRIVAGEKKALDVRDKEYNKIGKELEALKKDNPEGSVAHRAMLLQALVMEKRDNNPLSNLKYTAAGNYRKLIALAGPGALLGQPQKPWPDPYLEQAYKNYLSLSARIDKANQGKSVYKLINFLVHVTGANRAYSYWFAVILITLLVKLLTTPLSHLQFESMRNMQRIQPLIEKLKRETQEDPKEFQRQQWQLMKDHNASPHWGCLALLVQMPFLLLLYQMIRAYEFQFANGSFLWIGSRLAESLPFVGASLADPDWPLLILYGVSMYISTKMSTPATDPAQAQQQKMMSLMMPAMFVLIFNYFPSAFILYWLTLNILTTTQQYFMLNKPVPALALEDEEDDPSPEMAAAAIGARGPRPRKRK